MNLTRAAIEKNRVTLLALLVVLVGGLATFKTIPRDEDPGFTIRTALVQTALPGASPARVEQLVTEKLEELIQEMPELDFVTSESKTGLSLIFVNVQQSYRAMRPIWDSLRRKVEKATPALPPEVIGPVVNDEFGDVFGVILTMTGEGFTASELHEIAQDVRDELLRIDEVAKVELHGVQEEVIHVEYDDARLAELGLSPLQFRQILEGRNIIIPGGNVRVTQSTPDGTLLGDERLVLEPSGNFESIEDLRRTVVALPGRHEVVYLEDLADITRAYEDPVRTLVRASGTPAIAVAVSMRKGGNIIDLGNEVRRRVAELKQELPHGIDFVEAAFQPDRVDRKVREFVVSLLQSIGIVFASMLLFLGLRTGLVVASLVPAAIVMSVLLMPTVGMQLDQLSLSSLIIALGMLVDNAIVVSESTLVRMGEGVAPVEAAVLSANELQVPLLVATLTTAAAFLPIKLAKSVTGEYTGGIFVVVTLTLLCSWILALTMVPLLCARFLRAEPRSAGGGFDRPIHRAYRRALTWSLRRRWGFLALTALVFAGSLALFRLVPVIFFPTSDRSILTADLRMPAGTPIERTADVVAELESFLAEELAVGRYGVPDEGVTDWSTYVGDSPPKYILNYNPTGRAPERGYLLVNATSAEILDGLIQRLEAHCFERHPDLRATISRLDYGPPVVWPIEVRILGEDVDRLYELADGVSAELRAHPGVKDVQDDWGIRTKKLLVQVDQARAYRAGISNRDVALSLQTVLSGLEVSEFREDDDVIPISMRSAEQYRDDVDKISGLNVFAQATGRSVPLTQVADLEIAWQASNIRRRDGLRALTVQASLRDGVTATEVSSELAPWLEAQDDDWGLGYRWELGGESETSGEANASIAEQLPLAGFVILLLLVTQFNSLRKTAIVVATIPLGLIGVVVGLLVCNAYFGFMTLLGIISLAGIVINNAIVLLDRIRIEIEENGLEPAAAILEAAQRRLRPILLTTVTTVGGLLPLALDPGGMFFPMAIAILFGLLFATLLTLGVVPVLYSVLYRVPTRDL